MAKKVAFAIDFFNTEIGNSNYTSGLPYYEPAEEAATLGSNVHPLSYIL